MLDKSSFLPRLRFCCFLTVISSSEGLKENVNDRDGILAFFFLCSVVPLFLRSIYHPMLSRLLIFSSSFSNELSLSEIHFYKPTVYQSIAIYLSYLGLYF